MKNYKYIVHKNSYRSKDNIEKIVGIELKELSDTPIYDAICLKQVRCHVDVGSSWYDEHEEFYFQAKDAMKAMSFGFSCYINKKKIQHSISMLALNLYLEEEITLKKALVITDDEAMNFKRIGE